MIVWLVKRAVIVVVFGGGLLVLLDNPSIRPRVVIERDLKWTICHLGGCFAQLGHRFNQPSKRTAQIYPYLLVIFSFVTLDCNTVTLVTCDIVYIHDSASHGDESFTKDGWFHETNGVNT